MKNNPLKNAVAPVLLAFAACSISTLTLAADDSKKEPWQLAEETEVWEPVPPVVSTPVNAAPSDAVVLFDGKDLSKWESVNGGAAAWTVGKGALTVAAGKGDIRTKESFCDAQLHIEWKTPTKITGADGKVNGLKYKDRATNDEHLVPLEGVFVQIGLVPNTEFLKGTVELTRFGEIVVDAKGHTNVEGVFAAGDCTTVPYKQIVIAAGEGAKAALSAFDHLIRQPVPAEAVAA